MGKGYIMCKQNNHKFTEGGGVFHQADEVAAVAEKINTFITKKDP